MMMTFPDSEEEKPRKMKIMDGRKLQRQWEPSMMKLRIVYKRNKQWVEKIKTNKYVPM